MTSIPLVDQGNDLNDEYSQKILALKKTIDHYRETIKIIEDAADLVTDQQISDVFAACKQSHDSLEALISEINAAKDAEKPSSELLQSVHTLDQNINQLDTRLRKKSEFIQKSIELFNWQKTYLLPDKSKLKLIDPPVARDQFDWFWKVLSLILFGISFAFLTDIIKRSLTGGIDVGSVGTIVASALLSLGSGGALIQFGQGNARQFFSSLKIREQWQGRALAGISFLLLILLLAIWFSLPGLAGCYINHAERAENLAKREDYYNRAIALEPGNIKAHLGLADLYYDQEEYDRALEKYRTVWKHNKKQDTKDSESAIKALEQITQIALLKNDVARANNSLKKLLAVIAVNKKSGSFTENQLALIQKLGRIYLINEKTMGKPLICLKQV